MKRLVLLIAALICLAPVGFADAIVYDNGAPNQVSGNEMMGWIQADDFTFLTTTTVTDVHFWTLEDPDENGYAGSIWYGIYNDAIGQPALSPIVSGVVVGPSRTFIQSLVLGYLDEYAFSFNIAPFSAVGGTTYWLGLHNGDPADVTGFDTGEIYWETTNSNLTLTGFEDVLPPAGDGWFANNLEHAFQLTGPTPVPEPSSLLLLGAGLVGLAGMVRRKLR